MPDERKQQPGGDPGFMDVSDIARKYLDVRYADSDEQAVDIYLPDGEGPFPVIVNIHGGGFTQGSKRWSLLRPMLDAALGAGYAYVTLDYRIREHGQLPRTLFDCKAAIRFLRGNADQYGLDASRIGVIGDSAGAWLTMALAATGDQPAFDGPVVGCPGVSSAIQCAVGEFGIYDILGNDDMHRLDGRNPFASGQDMLGLLMDTDLKKNPEMAELFNVFNMVSRNMPPILLQHGTGDEAASWRQSVKLAEIVNGLCGEGHAEVQLIEGANHIGPEFYTPENMEKLIVFFNKQLKGA